MRRPLLVSTVALSVLAFLASCGGGEDKSKEQSTSKSEQSSTSTSSTTPPKETPREEPKPETPKQPAGPNAQEAAAAAARQRYDDAVVFAKENRASYRQVLERLRRDVTALEGTEWKDKLNKLVDEIKSEMDVKGEEAYAALLKDMMKCVADRNFEGAAKVIVEFPKTLVESQAAKKVGALKDKLTEEQKKACDDDFKAAVGATSRGQLGKAMALFKKLRTYAPSEMHGEIDYKISELEQKVLEEGEAALRKAKPAYDVMFEQAAKLVEAGQTPEALDKSDEFGRLPEYEIARLGKPDDDIFLQYDALGKNIKRATDFCARIVAHFTSLVGQSVEVQLRAGKETVAVQSVEGGVITVKSGGKTKTVGVADLRLEDALDLALKDGAIEDYEVVIGFCLASGRLSPAQRMIRKAKDAGLDTAALEEELAAERKKGEEDLKSKAAVMEKVNKYLERAVTEFKAESLDECLQALQSVVRSAKGQPPEIMKETSEKCATMSGYTLVALCKFARTSCKACGSAGQITCTKCYGQGQVQVNAGSTTKPRMVNVTCNQCGGRKTLVCKVCQPRRAKKDYEALEKTLIEAELK
ncbi:MAG: hypothetical protein RDV41_06375 [Planctomycetota bacterium]|nr:hypothetical protein [Planctomycetota bacterium]